MSFLKKVGGPAGMRFEFSTASRIIFGCGTRREAAPLVASFGRRVVLATGVHAGRAHDLVSALEEAADEIISVIVTGEPTISFIEEAVEAARSAHCDVVVSIGGGSVLDTGKAISALLTNRGNLFDYLEVIGRAQPLKQQTAPMLAIPTTSGTGAEVTSNSVLASPEHRVKVSLRSPLMLPSVAIVDPELTLSMPPAITASTGLDALTQVIEPFVSNKANPLTDSLCREGMALASRALIRAYEHGGEVGAREDMALVSLFGGLALSNAKLGAVHGFAGPIGGMFDAPHGMICARLLPVVVKENARALKDRGDVAGVLSRYAEISRILTGNQEATIDDGVVWLEEVVARLQAPSLSSFGITSHDIPDIVGRAMNASSMKGNPVSLTDDQLTRILAEAL